MNGIREHANSGTPGLPGALPKGERLLWQGAPDWRVMARRVFHVRKFAVYFALLLVWYAVSSANRGGAAIDVALGTARLAALAAVALGLLCGYAWLSSRSTVYTVTSRRVVMKFGIALPMTVNIPHTQVNAADVRQHADGSGDIALAVTSTGGLGYAVLWPHARPWHLARAQPSLRGLRDVSKVAQLVSRSLAASTAAQVAPVAAPRPGAKGAKQGQTATAAA